MEFRLNLSLETSISVTFSITFKDDWERTTFYIFSRYNEANDDNICSNGIISHTFTYTHTKKKTSEEN